MSAAGEAAANCKMQLSELQGRRRSACKVGRDAREVGADASGAKPEARTSDECVAATAAQKKGFKACRKIMKAHIDERNVGLATALERHEDPEVEPQPHYGSRNHDGEF